MGADTAGRKLGIGLRLAAKAVQQRAAGATTAPRQGQAPGRPYSDSISGTAARAARVAAQGPSLSQAVVRGAKRFASAFWGPMAHTGSVLSLEITGLFFALFALYFGQNVWKMRHDYLRGPEHNHLLIYSFCTLLFLWFTFSNFYRARKKERSKRTRLHSS